MSFARKWIELDTRILNKASQTSEDKYHMLSNTEPREVDYLSRGKKAAGEGSTEKGNEDAYIKSL